MNDNILNYSGIYSDYLFTFCNKYVPEKFRLIKKRGARNSLVSDSLNCGLNKQFSVMRFVIKQ